VIHVIGGPIAAWIDRGVFAMTHTDAENDAECAQSAGGTEWADYIRPFASMGDDMLSLLQDPDDSLERHELYEFIFSQMASAYVMQFYSDPAHPDWWPLYNHAFDAFWPNPDTIYYCSVVDSTGTYRLSGNRGKVRLADIQLGGGRFVTEGSLGDAGTGGVGVVQGNIDLDTLSLDSGGYFEVIVSPERPPGYRGNWIRMTPATTYFLLRQFSYDWSEQPVQISIERLDTSARGSRTGAVQLRKNLQQVSTAARTWINAVYTLAARDRARSEQAGDFVLVDWLASGLGGQDYHAFAFDLTDDEVVIVETAVPGKCSYWACQVVKDSWRTINPLKHQSSLNPEQSHLNKDGMFRAVVSGTDPGVRNWLDTGGYNRAMVYFRFHGCDEAPMPRARIVRKADLDKVLPADTPRFPAEEREASLRDRARKAQLRRRW
jgi:Protein of unknown function (DUF1214)